MPFNVPSNGVSFYHEVVDRCFDLIHLGIWAGIQPIRLRAWLNNFSGDEEKYFAACLLDGLIYRSEVQTEALTAQVFQRALPDLCRTSLPGIGQVSSWLDLFSSATDPGARLVAVLKPDDPPGKSGDVIARLLKREFRLNQKFVVQPADCVALESTGIRTFIFIDDLLGTGNQFKDVFEKSGASSLLANSYVVYAPLTAHIDGIGFLKTHFPTLKVCSGEQLDWSHSVFHAESAVFSDSINTPHEAKRFYYELLHKRNVSFDLQAALTAMMSSATATTNGSAFPLPPDYRRGFGHLELAYAFHHSVPDNCLPALWWSHSSNWNPLFDR